MNMAKFFGAWCKRYDCNYGKTLSFEIESEMEFIHFGFFCIIDLYDRWK